MTRTSWQRSLILLILPLTAGAIWAAAPQEVKPPTAALLMKPRAHELPQEESSNQTPSATPASTPTSTPSEDEPTSQPSLDIYYPLLGELRRPLKNSFYDARSGGRVHKAIDMMAEKGTPVVAAVDGVIKRMAWQYLAGRHFYLMTHDQKYVMLYAHLSGYAKGLKEGQIVQKGQILGYVGDTGNAKGHPHLHLAIYEILDMSKWWKGRPLNPYPMIMNAEAAPSLEVLASQE